MCGCRGQDIRVCTSEGPVDLDLRNAQTIRDVRIQFGKATKSPPANVIFKCGERWLQDRDMIQDFLPGCVLTAIVEPERPAPTSAPPEEGVKARSALARFKSSTTRFANSSRRWVDNFLHTVSKPTRSRKGGIVISSKRGLNAGDDEHENPADVWGDAQHSEGALHHAATLPP